MFHTEDCTILNRDLARTRTAVKTIDVVRGASGMTKIDLDGVPLLLLNNNDAYALAHRLLQSVGRSVILS